MQRKGGKLIVRGANEMISEVFEMTGFAGILNLE
jgi:anti-anti-sigma regulatory factor